MTPSEFKSWFEGFSESMEGVPSGAQWARIKARVAEIDGQPVTHTIYRDHYWPASLPRWNWYYGTPYPYGGALTVSNGSNTSFGVATGNFVTLNAAGVEPAFDSHSAMNMLGRAEAAELRS